MVRWHHRLNGHEFEQTLGDGEGQGSLVCWSMGMQRVRYDLTTEQQQIRCLTYNFTGCDLLLLSLLSLAHPIKRGAAFWSLESRVRLLPD